MPDAKIVVSQDGPYLVSGGLPLSKQTIGANAEGESIDWVADGPVAARENYALCRCGQSASKPFCDGTHAKVGFDGAETASRQPYLEQVQEIDGPVQALTDAEPLCAFARFCDRAGAVWNTVGQVRTPAEQEAFDAQVAQCPSGRLVAWDVETRKAIEPTLPPSIVLVEDPAKDVAGPIWVRGGVEIVAADGATYEVRNRVTLCRCGQSSNKPFCDGTHASIGFTD